MLEMNDVAKATLQQFNAAVTKIETREQKIADLKKVVAETSAAAQLHAESKKEISELEKLSQKDREFVKTAITFYEDITGEAVGIGGLFEPKKDGE